MATLLSCLIDTILVFYRHFVNMNVHTMDFIDSVGFTTGLLRAIFRGCPFNVWGGSSNTGACNYQIYKRRSQGHSSPSTGRRRCFLAFQPLRVRRGVGSCCECMVPSWLHLRIEE